MIKKLPYHTRLDAHYWQLFYSLFWLTAPVFWILGFVGSFYLSAYRYEKLVGQISLWKCWLLFIIFSLALIYLLFFHMLSFLFLNQISRYLPILILSWITTAGYFYYHARMFAVLVLKFNLNRNRQA